MIILELDRELQKYWMALPVEERLLTGCRLYEAEKALLEWLAPRDFSPGEVQEFVFYHMHGFELPTETGRSL